MLFLVDALHPNDNTESLNTGVEWSWHDALALRAGYQTLFQEDSELGATLGFGLKSGFSRTRFDFDYAWAGHERLDDTHRMTLVLVF
jgi:long-subunit fatty acid transport protein